MIVGPVWVILIMFQFFYQGLWNPFSLPGSHAVFWVIFVRTEHFVAQDGRGCEKHEYLRNKRFGFHVLIRWFSWGRFVRKKQDRLKKAHQIEHHDQWEYTMIVHPLAGTTKLRVSIFFILLLGLNELIARTVLSDQWDDISHNSYKHRNERKICIQQKELFHVDKCKLWCDDCSGMILNFFEIPVKDLSVLVPRCRVLNYIQRCQSTCGRWSSNHSGEVNALNHLDRLQTNHLVKVRPDVKL